MRKYLEPLETKDAALFDGDNLVVLVIHGLNEDKRDPVGEKQERQR